MNDRRCCIDSDLSPLCQLDHTAQLQLHTLWSSNYIFINNSVCTFFIFPTLLSYLDEKQPNTAGNESYIGIINVKLLFHFCCSVCYTSFERDKNTDFLWKAFVSAKLMIKYSGFLSSKYIWVKNVSENWLHDNYDIL